MLNVKIAAKRKVAEDICTFELVSEDGRKLPQFTAGSHIDVHVPGEYVRQYSLCNSTQETHRYLIGVLKDPVSRGGSIAMHQLEEGARLRVSEPKNHFPLEDSMEHSILVAGGIGITPIISMADKLTESGRSFELHYCVRTRNKAAFMEELTRERFCSAVRLHVDDEPDQKFDAEWIFKHAPGATPHVYVCGPSGFIQHVLDSARGAGYAEAQLHREYFGANPKKDDSADKSFEVHIASTGLRCLVGADESVVAALARHGIEIPTSCEQGVCGTCVTRVAAGVPLHRDLYLTDEERAANDQFTPCCSRSSSPVLVLDI
ncbi:MULTISPECIES: PDR/VanB family oxidoreductase [Paraburkholderia]|uniref:PDR/VanB family oxidoreductase n=1 Tax=Paraburkholderia TaxID=1822464 RepID=UPI002AAFCE07|nr:MULTISPECIES: PDR/VanB family oxidoreductase [Paraburkholderia]